MHFSNLKDNFRKPDAKRLLQWKLGWHDETSPKSPSTGVPVPFMPNDGKILNRATEDTLTWIGHASFLLQLGGKSILIDPVFSNALGWIKRNAPPGLNWATLPKIDVVLITHNHRDHMDAPTIKRLGKEPIYVVPKGLGPWYKQNGYKRVIEMSWWQQENIEGLNITFVPAEHWSRRGLNDTNTSWWGGYLIEKGGIVTYNSGDTAWFDGFAEIRKQYPKIHVAMLPIGAYAPRWFMKAQHVDPEEAVQAYSVLEANCFIPMHWGSFKLSDEPLDEPPTLLRAIWEQQNIARQHLEIPAIGETLLLDRIG